jgi:hypothetical protein
MVAVVFKGLRFFRVILLERHVQSCDVIMNEPVITDFTR